MSNCTLPQHNLKDPNKYIKNNMEYNKVATLVHAFTPKWLSAVFFDIVKLKATEALINATTAKKAILNTQMMAMNQLPRKAFSFVI